MPGTETLLNILFGGGFLASLGTLWWNRGKLRVDRQVATEAGLTALVEQLQQQLKDERAETESERAARQACEVGKREAEGRVDGLLRSEGALAHELDSLYAYVLANFRGLATGMVPPLLIPPYVLHERLPPDSIPYIVARRYDTGVPGVDPNPPFPDPPAPPDDGQDHNLQE